ncbi:MAG: metal-dependent hydrolase [Ignavibacteriales bacterium]|nr:metal-dependent hydrolase [Ignavibacteriales bacterium]
MDILTHTLSGVAIGTVVSSFANSGFKNKLGIVLISGFAGALPDLDAISLWSGFDPTIGNLFNLSESGKDIYSAKFWYSHHAFLHSAFAGLLIAGLLGLISYLIDSKFKGLKNKSFLESLYQKRIIMIGFFLGFLIHLIEDMPTPASNWGGVNFFWPSKSYIGGTGDIWWWNNYDIFLIVFGVMVTNLILHLIQRFAHFDLRKFIVGVFIIGFSIAIIQIKTRDFDFAYSGHSIRYQEFEDKSKQQQKEILGDKLYRMMENFDNKLNIYF